MKAGQLRHRVTLETETKTQSSSGALTSTWATLDKVWAQIEPMSSRELMEASQRGTNETHKVTLRYRDDLTTKERVKFGTRVLNIGSLVNVGERNRTLVLMCEEVVN